MYNTSGNINNVFTAHTGNREIIELNKTIQNVLMRTRYPEITN